MITCRHWSDCGVNGGGCCKAGHFHRPSHGVCMVCPHYDGPDRKVARVQVLVDGAKLPTKSRGLGDTIHKVTSALRIPHCGGCEQRRQKLNRMLPYADRSE